jgi:hypothetical protein
MLNTFSSIEATKFELARISFGLGKVNKRRVNLMGNFLRQCFTGNQTLIQIGIFALLCCQTFPRCVPFDCHCATPPETSEELDYSGEAPPNWSLESTPNAVYAHPCVYLLMTPGHNVSVTASGPLWAGRCVLQPGIFNGRDLNGR